jgi:hypothetical protein
MKLNDHCAKPEVGFSLFASLLSVTVAAYGFEGHAASLEALVAFPGMGLFYSALFIASWQRRKSAKGIASALLVIISSPIAASYCLRLLNHQGDPQFLQCIGLFSLALSTSLWGMHDAPAVQAAEQKA